MEAVRADEDAEVDLLGLGEQSGGLGRVGEDEGADDGEDHSGDTLYEAARKKRVKGWSSFEGRRTQGAGGGHSTATSIPQCCGRPRAGADRMQEVLRKPFRSGARVEDGCSKAHLFLGWKDEKRVGHAPKGVKTTRSLTVSAIEVEDGGRAAGKLRGWVCVFEDCAPGGRKGKKRRTRRP